jgi:Ca-activated chloride channel family protein
MRSSRAIEGSLWVAALFGLSCTGFHLNASATASVSVGGGYAAMDEVPVGGGELRLAEPKVIAYEGMPHEMIGFPLKHTAITAKVGGTLARYEVEQEFDNPYDEPIEAVYVFPLGDDGAVSGYQITIGDRTIRGDIHTKDDARHIYDEARAAGHTAAIIEQNKPNIFTQRIANIAPHEAIKIKITYIEMPDYNGGTYALVVPLTVGPRYLPADHVGANPVAAHAYLGGSPRPAVTSIPYIDATRASSTVSFTAELDPGVPIVNVSSPSHDIVTEPETATRSRVTLGRSDEIPNRDLIIRYQTAGAQTTVGLVTHRVDENGYFVLNIQPKATYRTGDITSREVLIVIDRSGSMDGAPLAQAKAVASALIDSLSERDSFNVIAFSSGVASMSDRAVACDAGGKQRGLDYLKVMQSGGGTEMEQGVVRMLQSTPGNDRIRTVYFLTDGFVGNDDVVVGAAKKLLGTNRIFTVGIGSAPNRSLLDRLAQAGRGFASYLTLTEPAAPLAKDLIKRSAYPYLTDISIDWGGLEVSQLTPAIVPDVYAGQPIVISGRYNNPGTGKIQVSATNAGRRVVIPIDAELPARADFEPVASLWARRQIEVLMSNRDEQDPSGPVAALGLRYHLVTEYTSFVAVDRTRIVSNGQVRVVEQPAIVPEGVNPATTIDEQPPAPSSSSGSRHSSSHDDGGGFGGWGSGGSDDDRDLALVMFAAMGLLGALWLTIRRFA